MVKIAATQAWQRDYDSQKDTMQMGTIKPTICHWPWATHSARAVETALARLRISHVELNSYLHRFNQSDTPLCQTCNTPETVDHYLLTCRRYAQNRRKLSNCLQEKGISSISKKILLGGGNYKPTEQKLITEAVGTYLKKTRRLNGMSTN